MVIYSSPSLDQTFAALADPTRRQMLASLAGAERLAVGDLARPLAMSLPAVLKHVNVLVEARLIRREKVGRTVYCQLEPRALAEARQLLEHYERFWSERLDALAQLVEREEANSCPLPNATPAPPQASRSAARSKPRKRASGAPGRSRKR